MENPDFAKHAGNGFTLVLEEFQELTDKIQAIINHDGGKLLFNKVYNNEIANPVLISLLGSFKQKP